MTLIRTILIGVLVLCATSVQASVDSTNKRIQGVSKFLVNRAEANLLYIFEQKIKDNKVFQCYFPNTYYYAARGDLTFLLKSGEEIWRDSVESDIRSLFEFYAIHKVVKGKVSENKTKILKVIYESLLESYKNVIKPNVEDFINNIKPFTTLDKDVQRIDILQQQYRDLLIELRVNIEKLKEIVDQDSAAKTQPATPSASTDAVCGNNNSWAVFQDEVWKKYYRQIKVIIPVGKALFTKLAIDISSISISIPKEQRIKYMLGILQFAKRNNTDSWWLKILQRQDKPSDIVARLKKENPPNEGQGIDTRYQVHGLNNPSDIYIRLQTDKSVSVSEDTDTLDQLHALIIRDEPLSLKFMEFERLAKEKGKILNLDLSGPEYRKFRKLAMFFTQLSEADDAEKVQALLKSITLPPVSFGLKRQVGESHLMLSSFVGFGAGYENLTSKDRKAYGSVVAPLGIEWSHSYGKNCWLNKTMEWLGSKGSRSSNQKCSLSVMLAPFDFGLPVTLEIGGKTETVEAKDVVAPGVFFSYGFNDLPLVTGVAWQKGKMVRSDFGPDDGDRWFLYVSFDMPLFMLY